jgi:hypothetical protein
MIFMPVPADYLQFGRHDGAPPAPPPAPRRIAACPRGRDSRSPEATAIHAGKNGVPTRTVLHRYFEFSEQRGDSSSPSAPRPKFRDPSILETPRAERQILPMGSI